MWNVHMANRKYDTFTCLVKLRFVQCQSWFRWNSFWRGNKGFPNRFRTGIGRFNYWECEWVRWPLRTQKATSTFRITVGRMECLPEVRSSVFFQMRDKLLVSDPTIADSGRSLDRENVLRRSCMGVVSCNS